MIWQRNDNGDPTLQIGMPLQVQTQQIDLINDSQGPMILNGGMATGPGTTILKDGAGPLMIANQLQHSGGVTYQLMGGTTTFASDISGAPGSAFMSNVSSGVANPSGTTGVAARVDFVPPQQLDTLSIRNNGLARLQHPDRAASAVKQLNVAPPMPGSTPSLDITDDGLVVRPDTGNPLDQIRALVQSGFAAGMWNGPGIVSSVAAADSTKGVGYGSISDLGGGVPVTFMGQPVDTDDVVARFTLLGDADLNAFVNISDFARLATNFNGPGDWARGDFTYDLLVDINDFARLALNFNLGLAGTPDPAAIPEPGCGTVAMMGLIAGVLTQRRNRG
jgi:hypothetical protein